MRGKLIPAGVFIIIIVIGWWIYEAPQKDISQKTKWAVDEETKREVPLFELYYKWDGVEETDPTWMIFPKEGKWWVLDSRDVMRVYSEVRPESELREKVKQYRDEFTHSWIEDRRFQPKASRFEAVMTALGFRMFFRTEQKGFVDFLKSAKDFDKGQLRPLN